MLETLITSFPFTIQACLCRHGRQAFHANNGSEYINHRVARLLNKLHVQVFTKSRARRTNDNALVESKNGSVVRKHLGYAHIPGRFASRVNHFTQQVLSPYLNFHRPCFYPKETVDATGRLRKRYRYEDMMTPCDKLKSLPCTCLCRPGRQASHYLKQRLTFEQMDAIAYAMSDNEAASQLNRARAELFRSINNAPAHAV